MPESNDLDVRRNEEDNEFASVSINTHIRRLAWYVTKIKKSSEFMTLYKLILKKIRSLIIMSPMIV